MQPLDQETADYMAATRIREALIRVPACHYVNVEATVKALYKAHLIDLSAACYVTLNADRFCVLPAPIYFDAEWHAQAELLQGAESTSSAHPFPS
jgi:hypothetical protein